MEEANDVMEMKKRNKLKEIVTETILQLKQNCMLLVQCCCAVLDKATVG